MAPGDKRGTGLPGGLSWRLLLLTLLFAMLSEILIFVPSAARFALAYMDQRVGEAHLASLAVMAAPDNVVSPDLQRELLGQAGSLAIALKLPDRRYLIAPDSMPPKVDTVMDLREIGPAGGIVVMLRVFFGPGDRTLLVIGAAQRMPEATVETIVEEAPLQEALYAYGRRILALSILISLLTATLVYLSLQWLFVRPMRRLASAMTSFRAAPEDPARIVTPSQRGDEIGAAEAELAALQLDLQQALAQKTRLAALGMAISKINHDLRNILANAQLLGDRLKESADPAVRRVAPRLVESIDRAIDLCVRTLRHGRAEEPPPLKTRVDIAQLWHAVGEAAALPADGRIAWEASVPPRLSASADEQQLFRVLLNLGRNGIEAIPGRGHVRLVARPVERGLEMLVEDSGAGLPEAARDKLFEPFSCSGRSGGTGLGLSIARDIVLAHGGSIELARTGPTGTAFRVFLPEPLAQAR